jgi:hypothetical protein
MNPNGIKKNDWILVTRKAGDVVLGVATKVGPWKKNPALTVVNYHFKQNGKEYASRADGRQCAKAPASMIPQPAKTDPIMARWSLGKEHRGPQMMEGYLFYCSVYLLGKKVGELIDEGNGGDMEFHGDHRIGKSFAECCEKWEAANDPAYNGHTYNPESSFYEWWHRARPDGKDAKTYFIETNAQFKESISKQTLTPATESLLVLKGASDA